MPSRHELAEIATNTLLEFDTAVREQDFKSFHSGVSALWKLQTIPSEIAVVFQEFVEIQPSIAGVKDISPVFTTTPAIDERGMLALSGYYATAPLRVLFDLNYNYEQLRWKLISIKINLAE